STAGRRPLRPRCRGWREPRFRSSGGNLRTLCQRRIMPDVGPPPGTLGQPRQTKGGPERVGVRLVRIEPTQLLGELVAERTVEEWHDAVGVSGPAEHRRAVMPDDRDLGVVRQ